MRWMPWRDLHRSLPPRVGARAAGDRVAAVDPHDLAGHVRGGRGEEPADRRGDVRRASPAGRAACRATASSGSSSSGQRPAAGRDDVRPHAVAGRPRAPRPVRACAAPSRRLPRRRRRGTAGCRRRRRDGDPGSPSRARAPRRATAARRRTVRRPRRRTRAASVRARVSASGASSTGGITVTGAPRARVVPDELDARGRRARARAGRRRPIRSTRTQYFPITSPPSTRT